MTTNRDQAQDSLEFPPQCPTCRQFFTPESDPNKLDFYVHLHVAPEEVVDRLTVPALHSYLVAVLEERWPDQLLLQHGVDQVRRTLRMATAFNGLAFKKGGIRSPAAYLRWLLTTQPPLTTEPQENPFTHWSD